MDQRTKLIVGVGVLALAALLIGRTVTGGRVRGKAPQIEWFYDLKTGQLFTAAAKEIPPIAAPSDPTAGVRAYVFSCGSCDETNRKVMYIETFTDSAREARVMINELSSEPEKAPLWSKVNQGNLVAAPPAPGQEPQWVQAQSSQGAALTQAFWTMCGRDGHGKLCPAK